MLENRIIINYLNESTVYTVYNDVMLCNNTN